MLVYPLMPMTGFPCKQKLHLSSGTNFYEYISWNVGCFYKVCKWKWKILRGCPGMWKAYISVWTWVSKPVLAFKNSWFMWFRALGLADWWYMTLYLSLYLTETPMKSHNSSSSGVTWDYAKRKYKLNYLLVLKLSISNLVFPEIWKQMWVDLFSFPSSPPWADRTFVMTTSVSCGERKALTHFVAKTKSAGIRDHTELALTIGMWHTFVSQY